MLQTIASPAAPRIRRMSGCGVISWRKWRLGGDSKLSIVDPGISIPGLDGVGICCDVGLILGPRFEDRCLQGCQQAASDSGPGGLAERKNSRALITGHLALAERVVAVFDGDFGADPPAGRWLTLLAHSTTATRTSPTCGFKVSSNPTAAQSSSEATR